jgi:enoyl-CoA hydratase/3-hydroxyacyl-CoA dehydrogenase
MNVEDVKHVAVLGSGLMGHGIAQTFAQAGYKTTMIDIKEEYVQAGLEKIKWSLGKLLEKTRITQVVHDDALANLSTTTDRAAGVKDADLVIEAIPEIMDLKQKVFAELEKETPAHAILATNTSSLPISEIAEATEHPEKVVGMHFFSPVVRMDVVEIIKGNKTTDAVAQLIFDLTQKIGKAPVMCNKDIPGFIANGVMMFPLNFVGQLIDQDKFKIEEIDSALHFNIGMRMAVFGLIDFVGIDVTYNILKFMATRIEGMTLAKCLEDRVQRGDLGVKTGKGFYEYPTGRWAVPPSWSPSLAGKFDPQFVTSVAINRAAALVDDDVASPADIDKTLKLGFNLPLGMLEIADSLGIDTVVEKLEHIAKEYDQFYAPHPLLQKMVKAGKLGQKSGEGFFKY